MIKPPPSPPPTKRRRPIIVWILLGAASFCIIGVCGVGGYFFGGETALTATRADEVAKNYRSAGLPWTAKDLQPDPPLADQENAANLIRKATAEFDKPTVKDAVKAIDQAVKVKDWETVGQLVKSFQPQLALLVQASKKKGLGFHYDWDMSANLLTPEYAQIKRASNLLAARGTYRASIGDSQGAVSDITAAHRLGVLTGKIPTIIPMLVAIACQNIAYRAVVDSAETAYNSHRSLTPYIDLAKKLQAQADFHLALRGEAYVDLAVCRNVKSSSPKALSALASGEDNGEDVMNDAKHLVRSGLPKNQLMRASAVRFMEFWTKAEEDYKAHPNDVRAFAYRLETGEKMINGYQPSSLLLAIMIPVFGQAGDAVVRNQAVQNATIAYVQALDYKDKHGQFPDSLDQLPGDHIDPFTNEKLKTAYVNNQYRVYSVGSDMSDDGGQTKSEIHIVDPNSGPHSGDIVVPNP